MIVSDSGPLISLARVRKLWLLKELFGEVFIPEAVYRETVEKGKGKPGAEEIATARWIKTFPIKAKEKLSAFQRLGAGEAEAIILAEEQGLLLLVDDPLARKEAKRRGVKICGVLEVLLEAKRKGLIGEVKPILLDLMDAGFRLSSDLYWEVLKKA